MNKFVACLAVIAMVAYTSSASTPCTQVCGGQCALAKQACEVTGLMGDFCAASNKVCVSTCAIACQCVDECATKCDGAFATCKTKDSSILNVATCGLNLSTCATTCQTTCRFNQLAAVINGMTGGAAAKKA